MECIFIEDDPFILSTELRISVHKVKLYCLCRTVYKEGNVKRTTHRKHLTSPTYEVRYPLCIDGLKSQAGRHVNDPEMDWNARCSAYKPNALFTTPPGRLFIFINSSSTAYNFSCFI